MTTLTVGSMDARTELERDAVKCWLYSLQPGPRSSNELHLSYDAWSDRMGAPEIEKTIKLGFHLKALGLERWRTGTRRGWVVPARQPDLTLELGRALRGVLIFVNRLAPGQWSMTDAYRAYGRWVIEAALLDVTEPWFRWIVERIAQVPVDGDAIIITGRPS